MKLYKIFQKNYCKVRYEFNTIGITVSTLTNRTKSK